MYDEQRSSLAVRNYVSYAFATVFPKVLNEHAVDRLAMIKRYRHGRNDTQNFAKALHADA